ncbi:transposase [Colletotrichum incanum]|nr:transposase [Colletotrichum incanum]
MVAGGDNITHHVHLSAKEIANAELAQQLRKKGIITTLGEPFEQSTKAEITALIDRRVFRFIPFNPITYRGFCIFRSRIVNEVKNKTTDKPYEKSCLVIQGYSDNTVTSYSFAI